MEANGPAAAHIAVATPKATAAIAAIRDKRLERIAVTGAQAAAPAT